MMIQSENENLRQENMPQSALMSAEIAGLPGFRISDTGGLAVQGEPHPNNNVL